MTPETRRTIEELLPFHANGTLEGDERAAVEAALAEDADLRAEFEVLQALRQTMQAEEVHGPGELGLARLMRDVEARDAAPAPMSGSVVPMQRHRLWQIAAGVMLAIGLGQAALLFGDRGDQGYDLASGGPADAAFVVGFAPGATEAEIRAVLLRAGVDIVAGPSALGLYSLGLPDTADPEAAAAALAAALGSTIETLESIDQ